jgi:peptidoglycan/LPS O-acetylase OafA/YrhL
VLDTLRAVGAFAVLTTHVFFWSGDYTRHGALGTVLARLDVGVAIFFVLSGFLLARPYLAAAATGREFPSTGRYLWKRFLRITPVYLVTVVVALALIASNRDRGPVDWLVTTLMSNTFVDPSLPAGLTQMWSLAVEVTFYLTLPLLMVVAVGRRPVLRTGRVLAVLAGMVAVAVWWHLAGAADVDRVASGVPQQWLPAYLTWFAVGIGLALVHTQLERGRWRRVSRAVRALGALPGTCWALAVGLLVISATPIAGPTLLAAPTSGESLVKNVVYAAIGGLLVLTGVFADTHGRYARAFGAPVARRLGWISYSLFCLHLPVLHLVMWVTGWPLFEGRGIEIWLLTAALSVVVADLAYRLVERPALRLKRLRTGPAAAASTAASGTSTRS